MLWGPWNEKQKQKVKKVPIVININFLLTISIQCQEIRLWKLIKWSPHRKCFDLLSNSLNLFFMKMCIETSLENLYVNIGAKRINKRPKDWNLPWLTGFVQLFGSKIQDFFKNNTLFFPDVRLTNRCSIETLKTQETSFFRDALQMYGNQGQHGHTM